MRFLRQNLGLKVLSLVLAIVFWGIVRINVVPTGEVPASRVFIVPIRVTSPEQADLEAEASLREVTLTLRGKRNVIQNVLPAMIRADVDLTRRTAGNYLEKVNVLAPGGTEVVEVEPTHIGVKISRRETSQVPVRIEVRGELDPGFQAQEPVVDPRSVKVYGPEDQVRQVVAVQGQVNLSGGRQGESLKVKLTPVNAQGMEVGGMVRLQPSEAVVTVPVNSVQQVRGVRVDPRNVQVSAPPGWEVGPIRIEPGEVTLEGPGDEAAPSLVTTERLIFTDVTTPKTQQARVLPPKGFSVVGDPTVRVTVRASRKETGEASAPATVRPQ